MSKPRHSLENLDEGTKTAVCAVCGPVAIYLMNKGGGRRVWVCYTSKLKGISLHRISSPNKQTMRGTCSTCGVVGVKIKTIRLGKEEWRCRNKLRELNSKWQKSEKGRAWLANYHRAWNAANPDLRSRCNRKQLLKMHGLTIEDYDRMVAEREGRCDTCQEKPAKLFVDHCHATMRIRGLLCSHCNSVLGYSRDRPEVLERCSAYLRDNLPQEDTR